ncbi:MAG: hypothetical protein AAF725_02770 [Acidobacteriota bacterium]
MIPRRLSPSRRRYEEAPGHKSARGFAEALGFLAASLLLALSAAAAPAGALTCQPGPTSEEESAWVSGLRVLGSDLKVDLWADPARPPLAGGAWVEIGAADGHVLDSRWASFSPAGEATVLFPNVLAGGDSRPSQHFVNVRLASGSGAGDPFPFLLASACDSAPCIYRLAAGVQIGGLWMSRALAMALEGLPPCRLEQNLSSLTKDPFLSLDAQTFRNQLSAEGLPGSTAGCDFEWVTVVPDAQLVAAAPARDSWLVFRDDLLIAEGLEEKLGAGACTQFQGTSGRLLPEAWDIVEPRSSRGRGRTELEQRILCVSGNGACQFTACQGEVELSLDSCRAVRAYAAACGGEGAEASASAQYSLDLTVGFADSLAAATLGVSAEASGSAGEVEREEFESWAYRETLGAPARAMVSAGTELSYSSSSPERALDAYGLAESVHAFRLALRGSSACTLTPVVEVSVEVFPAALASFQAGGLKMRRWWPPDRTVAAVPGQGAVPAICPSAQDSLERP